MAESSTHLRTHNRSPSYNSAESGGVTPIDIDNADISRSITPPHSPISSAHPRHPHGHSSSPRAGSPSPGRYDRSAGTRGHGAYGADWSKGLEVNVRSLGRAVVSRVVRAARRGNLPFLVIFMSCLVFFFSALAGIGYVDPDTVTPIAPAAQFVPGLPVFVPNADSEIGRRKKADELRELEKEWQKKRRPREKQRDDKAIRRVAPKEAPAPPAPILEELDKRDIVEEQRVYDLGGSDEAYEEGQAETAEQTAEPEEVGISADQLEQEQEEGIEISEEEKQAAVEKGGEAAEAVKGEAVIGEADNKEVTDQEAVEEQDEGKVL